MFNSCVKLPKGIRTVSFRNNQFPPLMIIVFPSKQLQSSYEWFEHPISWFDVFIISNHIIIIPLKGLEISSPPWSFEP